MCINNSHLNAWSSLLLILLASAAFTSQGVAVDTLVMASSVPAMEMRCETTTDNYRSTIGNDGPAHCGGNDAQWKSGSSVPEAVSSNPLTTESQGASILVIVDTSVENYQEILSGLDPAITITLLDATKDGVIQITGILSGYTDISSLHIVSHGSSGHLRLGSSELSLATLDKYKDQLSEWAGAFAPGADVLLYGCNVAAGGGFALLPALSGVFGADVAASTNVTGSTISGGDWYLEAVTGLIESEPVFDPVATETSSVVLALPAGFTDEQVIQNLNQPIAMALLPSGYMLILERPGKISITDPTQPLPTATTYLQIPDVDTNGEKGLLNIALDPDFINNKYFYVYYHNLISDRARISRFVHDTDHANPADEVVIWEDHITTATQIIGHHWGGGLDFGPDGYIYLTIGDKKDIPEQSQDLELSAGKIIRIDPGAVDAGGPWVTGADNSHLIPTSNPFVDGPGGNLDEIWALGLRNPFRAEWDIPTGRFFIGEVGGNVQTGPDASYEDLHMVEVTDAGANFGWPNCEGPGCAGPVPVNYSAPAFSIQHPDSRSIVAGAVYRANLFPTTYHDALFLADYTQGWLRYLTFDAAGNVSSDVPVGGFPFSGNGEFNSPVALEVGPEGALYYASLAGGYIGRINYANGNQPPVISQAAADSTSSPVAPFSVNFTGAATDPEGEMLAYLWDFGDGTQATTSSAVHNYTSKGTYIARLSVSDPGRTTISDTIVIEVGEPPIPSIADPVDGHVFRAGEVINLRGSGSDADGVLTNDSFKWTVNFIHDTHFHPVLTDVPGTPCPPDDSTCQSFTVPSTSHDFADQTGFEISLTATDSDGLVRTDVVSIVPDKVDLTFDSNVPGDVTFFLDQIPRTGPFTYDTLIDFEHDIKAPEEIVAGGDLYVFDGWSNGVSTATQSITVPDVDTTYTANYINTGPPPRISNGLQVLYAFEAGSGNTVFDVSGVGLPLDLTINDLAAVTWGTGSLTVNQSTLISSLVSATKLHTSIAASNEITIESWVSPANTTQNGPARIVTLSQDTADRNFTLGQGASQSSPGTYYNVRLRTTTTGNNGSNPSLCTPEGTLDASLTHVVYTRTADGFARLYLDDALVAVGLTIDGDGLIDGDMSNWDPGYPLALANEITGDRPWTGTLDLVAVYDRALTADDVNRNFYAGPDSTTGRIAPLVFETTSLSDAGVGVGYTQNVSVAGGLVPYSWTLDTGALPDGLGLDQATGVISGVPLLAGEFSFTLKVTDSAGAIATQAFTVNSLIDTDDDGLSDVDEINIYGTDPDLADTDGDGLSDGDEVSIHGTDPNLADTDGDGFPDGEEVNTYGTDPLFTNILGDLAPRGELNGVLDAADVLIMARLVTGQITATPGELLLGDLNHNSLLDAGDHVLLQRMILGSLPAP